MTEIEPFVIRFKPLTYMDDNMIAEFSSLNDDLRLERTAEGEITLMPPTYTMIGQINAIVTAALGIWARNASGFALDSSVGVSLPNGALRSPDASWLSKERFMELTKEQRSGYLPICPDFVLELRSVMDDMSLLQDKMQEYIDNGAGLGWLIDLVEYPRRVYVYRPNVEVEILGQPEDLSAEPELPGFTLNLREIWDLLQCDMAQMPTKPAPFVIKFKPLTYMDDGQLAKFCALNDDLRIERDGNGEIILIPPAHSDTSN